MTPLPAVILEPLVRAALAEDLGRAGDITSNSVIPKDARAIVVMAAREEGRIAGLDLAEMTFKMVDPGLTIRRLVPEGSDVKKGDIVLEVEGKARSILAAERTALNFVGHMSGIATLTQKMTRAVGNHKAKIAATRKTTPLLRSIEKYAVMVGGGLSHRYGLDDAILIKDNHIAIAGGIIPALKQAKENKSHTVTVEIEVDTLAQLDEVLAAGADIVMLDNMSLEDMTAAVKKIAGRMTIEASGNVTLARIPEIAATGVDLISSGAMTHSAPNFNVGLDFKTAA